MSNDLFQILKGTVREDFSTTSYATPIFFNQAADFFEKSHVCYCWMTKDWKIFERRQARLENEQVDPGAYAIGALLLSEAIPSVSRLVLAGLIIKCIDDLFDQHMKIYQAYTELKQAIHPQPIYKEYRWQKANNQTSFLPPSVHLKIQIQSVRLLQQSLKVMRCVSLLFWEIVKLGMCHRDVYLILTNQSQARLKALTEVALDFPDYVEKIKNDHEFLRQRITEKQVVLNKILKKSQIPEITDSTLEVLKKAADYIPPGIEMGKDLIGDLFIPGKISFLNPLPRLEEDVPNFDASISYSKKEKTEQLQQKLDSWIDSISHLRRKTSKNHDG